MYPHHHEGSRPALDRLGHVLADALESIQTFALHLLGQERHVEARQVLGQRLSTGRLRTLVSGNLDCRRLDLLLGFPSSISSIESVSWSGWPTKRSLFWPR